MRQKLLREKNIAAYVKRRSDAVRLIAVGIDDAGQLDGVSRLLNSSTEAVLVL
jgi:hypothetical protein